MALILAPILQRLCENALSAGISAHFSLSLSLPRWEALSGATFRGFSKIWKNLFIILKFFQKNIFQNFYHPRDGAQTPNYFSIFRHPIPSGWKNFCTLRTLPIFHLHRRREAYGDLPPGTAAAPRPHRVSGMRVAHTVLTVGNEHSRSYHLRSISDPYAAALMSVGAAVGWDPKNHAFRTFVPS